ncbi:MAG: hypothetical protein KIC80_04835 [Brachyspira sp.]|nr:hypothetical protein [Brachyspira sp.]
MKKKWLAVLIFLYSALSVSASNNVDYEAVYRSLEVPTHKYVHNIDPGEYYDTQNTTWSPYPLLRLTAPLYFKTIAIEPGYYALTPREYDGRWYMLFKEAGRIKYILPVYERDIVPEMFYDENLPQPKYSPTQKIHLFLLDKIGKFVPSAKRKPAPQTYLEMTDLDNNFISMVVYWGNHRYYMIYRTINL